jgi:hypothetical protein
MGWPAFSLFNAQIFSHPSGKPLRGSPSRGKGVGMSVGHPEGKRAFCKQGSYQSRVASRDQVLLEFPAGKERSWRIGGQVLQWSPLQLPWSPALGFNGRPAKCVRALFSGERGAKKQAPRLGTQRDYPPAYLQYQAAEGLEPMQSAPH